MEGVLLMVVAVLPLFGGEHMILVVCIVIMFGGGRVPYLLIY